MASGASPVTTVLREIFVALRLFEAAAQAHPHGFALGRRAAGSGWQAWCSAEIGVVPFSGREPEAPYYLV